MRTKTLLITAALSAAGAATAMAQVYSVNAVGYINLSVPAGFSIIANQLDAGTGNNVLSKLFTSVPDGTIIYEYSNGGYNISTFAFGSWDVDQTLAPGQAAWINNPNTAAITVTFVGNVPQGSLSQQIPAGFSLQSSQVPQSGALDTVLGYPAAEGDIIYRYAGGGYTISTYAFGAWDTVPTPNVGEGFWVNTQTAKSWTRNFSVNQ